MNWKLGWLLLLLQTAAVAAPLTGTVTVEMTPLPLNTFVPRQAFGAGVDGMQRGDVAQVYTPANLRAMSGVGFSQLTYRLRTELGIETWHWNPEGRWSDPTHQDGYWVSDAAAAKPLLTNDGYRLPRRGSTTDQANNDGYSQLDDGDLSTFWKSNPYLDAHFTGEPNTRHPQWVVIDLERERPVNAIHIRWAAPYAVRYRVEYCVGLDDPNGGPDAADFGLHQTYSDHSRWLPFPRGTVNDGRGGDVPLRLCDRPRPVRFVRVWMTESSGTDLPGSFYVRDGLGYAIRELALGTMDAAGRLHDWVRHAKKHGEQTEMIASSTDPWHAAADRDPQTEQPGFDRVFRSGLTHGLPVLVPVGVIYDTPENAVAELRFLKARGDTVRGVEMGEEPDGQFMTPEDYGALYIEWADALHRFDPALKLGGPCFQTDTDVWPTWADARGNRSWLSRFLGYLKRRGRLDDFAFFSFEWYPFDDVCAPPAGQLLQEPAMLADTMRVLQQQGLSRAIPWMITEYGYSAFAGQAEMDMPGALLNAEIVAQFLTLGGSAAYLYGLEPNSPIHEIGGCPTYGNLAVFLSDDARHIKQPLATFYGAKLLMGEWAQPASDRPHRVYRVSSDVRNAQGQALVTAYAVHRPDGQWAVLLLNKDPRRPHTVRLRFHVPQTGQSSDWRGPVTLLQYSPAQYVWHARGENGHASPDLPPATRTVTGPQVTLPPYSMTVARGRALK